MGSPISAAEFLKAIWGDSEGFAELTAIGKHGVKSFPWNYPGTVDSLLAAAENHNKSANVYMGVCLRKEKWPRPTGRVGVDGKQIFELRGTEANAHSAWVVWVEFDFIMANGEGHKGRVVDPEMARKWLAEFPVKPSIIVKSGGGIQVYWLLKEAATGDDLWRVKAINKALVEHFTVEIDGKKYGADTQSVDLARILRIPGSVNIKYTPPRTCEISWWHPESRYTLDDFDILNIHIEKPLLHQAGQSVPALQGHLAPVPTTAAAGPGLGQPVGGARPLPSIILPAEDVEFIRENVQALWLPGQKHAMALRVAGMLAHANVALESTVAIIRAVADATNSDTEKRVKDVVDTYNSFVSGKEVAGKTSLEQLVNSDFPQDSKEKALARVKAIAKKLPKAPRPPANGGGGGPGNQQEAEPDFQIKNPIVKFDSRPARWSVTLETTEKEEFTATIETINLVSFRVFQGFFFEQTHFMPGEISQRRWKMMIGNAEILVQPTPKESRPEGAIETALDEFLADARENPDYGMLSSFAGYDETSRFFRFSAFKEYLKEQDIRIEDRTIFHHMKTLGFKNDVKRFGPKTHRLWMQSQEPGNGPQNGNGHTDGPPIPIKPTDPVKPNSDPVLDMDLFPDSDSAVVVPQDHQESSVSTPSQDVTAIEEF